nr:a3.1 [Sporisorium sorghi]
MFAIFDVATAAQTVSVAEQEQAPVNDGRGQPNWYCTVA